MRILAILLALCLVSACEPKKTSTAPEHSEPAVSDSEHTSETALDWHGRYEGILPCADCEGMRTRLTLRPDHSYSLEIEYLGKEVEPLLYHGTFAWTSDGSTVYLNDVSEGPNLYFLGEGFVAQLDLEGKRITGELGEKYLLKKVPTPVLAGTSWVLEELMGQAIVAEPGEPAKATLEFSDDGDSAFGQGGCNGFRGSVSFEEPGRIKFAPLAATLKACPDLELEKQFFEVLEKADSFHYEAGRLELYRARMAPLAKFRLAPSSHR